MNVLFVLASLMYSFIAFQIVAVFSYDYLKINLFGERLSALLSSSVNILFSEKHIFSVAAIILLFVALSFVILLKKDYSKGLRIACFTVSLLSILSLGALIVWTVNLNFSDAFSSAAGYNVYFAVCVFSMIFTVTQMVLHIVNSIKYSNQQ